MDTCFPGHATVQTADGRRLAMRDLRTGDRVLAVGWDGKPRYQEVRRLCGLPTLLSAWARVPYNAHVPRRLLC
jgi:hypothetical protein